MPALLDQAMLKLVFLFCATHLKCDGGVEMVQILQCDCVIFNKYHNNILFQSKLCTILYIFVSINLINLKIAHTLVHLLLDI